VRGGFELGWPTDLDSRGGGEDRWRRPWAGQAMRGGGGGVTVALRGELAPGGDGGVKDRGYGSPGCWERQ
jgi:hypothetical protein